MNFHRPVRKSMYWTPSFRTNSRQSSEKYSVNLPICAKFPILCTMLNKSQFESDRIKVHRAWCDAEANAYVYLKLKELSGGKK